MSADVAAIVAGLTKAQREAVLFRSLSLREGLCRSPNIVMAKVLYRKGITEYPSYAVPFTPLGLAVRAALIAQEQTRER